jgi:hypothetical protein
MELPDWILDVFLLQQKPLNTTKDYLICRVGCSKVVIVFQGETRGDHIYLLGVECKVHH